MQSNGTEPNAQQAKRSTREDRYQHHDYYGVDDLLSSEHLLARDAVRSWVKSEVSPIIEDYSNRAQCPTHLFKGLAEIGAFGPSLPAEYGCGGMDEIAYGVIMQELERGDSGVRSIDSVTFINPDVGLLALVLVKPLAQMTIYDITAPVEKEFIIDHNIAPGVIDDAYLNFICLPSGSLAGAVFAGTIETYWS